MSLAASSRTFYSYVMTKPIQHPVEAAPEANRPTLTLDEAARLARIREIIARFPPEAIMSMKEFDALEYDEDGLLR